MRKIGIITSGGDAPGMNAAIRSVVRTAHSAGLEVLGFRHGWCGLVENDSVPLSPRSVSGILQTGGTILHTARCPEFKEKAMQRKAAQALADNQVDGLVVMGGEGSFRGGLALGEESYVPIVGVPATIDNDVYGTDETIGFDTAVNTALADIDRIRDTAVSHDRIFIVEVMGRKRGFLASMIGLTAGAEITLVPEVPFDLGDIVRTIRENSAKGKRSGIIVAAEGIGNTRELADEIDRLLGIEARLSILGYAQRGGNPTARSRYLACEFGSRAVELLLKGAAGRAVVIQDARITDISLEESCSSEKPLDSSLLQLAKRLAT
jgi:6-phosphofructokinase 1